MQIRSCVVLYVVDLHLPRVIAFPELALVVPVQLQRQILGRVGADPDQQVRGQQVGFDPGQQKDPGQRPGPAGDGSRLAALAIASRAAGSRNSGSIRPD